MSQTLDYSSIVATGAGWTNGANVATDDGTDYADCDPGGDDSSSGILKIALDNATDPLSSSSHIITVNAKRSSGTVLLYGTFTFSVELRESGTLRASFSTGNLTSTDADKTYTLTSAEANSITNYNNLELWVVGNCTHGTDGYQTGYLDYAKLVIPDLALPGEINGLAASDGRTDYIQLTWTADPLSSTYEVWHTNNGGAADITGLTGTSYNWTGGSDGTNYPFWIKGRNATGLSATFNTSTYGYELGDPSAPTSVNATDGTYSDKCRISWVDGGDAYNAAASYSVFRDGGSIASGITALLYDDTTGVAGTVYSYTVKATNAAATSAASTANNGNRAAPGVYTLTADGGTITIGLPSSTLLLYSALPPTYAGTGTGAVAFLGVGTGVKSSGGGSLYGRLDSYAFDFVWDHRPATLEIAAVDGETGALVAGPMTILTAESIAALHNSESRMSIALGSIAERLNRRAQEVLLTGEGGDEGTEEVAGKPAPLCFGKCKNIPGVRVSVNEQRWLVYRDRAHAQPQSVDAVWLGENLLDSAYYDVEYSYATGTVVSITGTDVLDGVKVTFDVTGAAAAGNLLADVAKYLLVDIGPLTAAEINTDRFSRMNTLFPFPINLYIEDASPLAGVLNFLTGAVAWWLPDRNGLIDMGLTIPPDYDTSAGTLAESEIISVTNEPFTPPAKVVAVGYDVNPVQMGENDLAGAAKGTARGLWSMLPYRRSAVSQTQFASVYPSARTPEDYVLPLTHRDDAMLVQRWINATYGRPMRFYRLVCRASALRFNVGDVITFSFSRWGLSTPCDYRIAEQSLNTDWTVSLVVWKNTTGWVLAGNNTAGEYLVSPTGAPLGV